MTAWLIVLKKELIDVLRDKRSTSNILLMALLGPALALGMLTFMSNMILQETEKTIQLPVQGAEYAPQLLEYIRASNIEILPAVEDPLGSVQNRESAAVLMIPEDFAARFRQGNAASVELLTDHALTKSSVVRQRISAAIKTWSLSIGMLRLKLRGVDPDIANPVMIRDRDVSKGSSGRSKSLLSMLPYLLIIGILSATMIVATDLLAGERERQSLEPLLTNPVAPEQIMAGKLGANALLGMAALGLSLAGFYAGSRLFSMEALGLQLAGGAILQLLPLFLPLVFMFAAIMTFLAAFARSVKEAQSYLSIVLVAAMIPSMVAMLLQAKVTGAQLLLPVWSHNYLANKLLGGEALGVSEWIVPAAGALAIGLVFSFLSARLYNRPGLIFGNT